MEKRRMPRIVKPAAERRAEIIDCAVALFFEKGYEATTIADILERTNLSKGAFYHHFKSKEELLDAFAQRATETALNAVEGVLQDPSLSELKRLCRFFSETNRLQFDAQPPPFIIFETLLQPGNAVLYQRIQSVNAAVVGPVLRDIIGRGVARGEFSVADVGIAVEVMLHLAAARQEVALKIFQLARGGKKAEAKKVFSERLMAEQSLLERILGIPQGSIDIFEPKYVSTVVEMISRSPANAKTTNHEKP
jgi:AcrR family transcriptional regulator